VMSPAAIAAAAASLGSLAERVQEAMDAGIIREDDPMEIATIFWSACHGPVSLEMKFTGKATTNWTSVHRELIDAVILGLSPGPNTKKSKR